MRHKWIVVICFALMGFGLILAQGLVIKEAVKSSEALIIVDGGVPAAGGPSYIARETFDTNPGTDLTWVQRSATAAWNPDCQSGTGDCPLEGTESVTQSTGYSYYYTTISAVDEVWVSQIVNLAGSASNSSLSIWNSDSTYELARMRWYWSTDHWYPRLYYNNAGNNTSYTGTSVYPGQTWYLQLHYIKGTGSDAVIEAYVDQTGAFSSALSPTITNSSATAQAVRIEVSHETTGQEYDDVRIDDEAISY